MLGSNLVILWLVFFGIISILLCKYLKLNTSLLCTIFVWTFLMVFIYIFEMMLLFYNEYLEIKGKQYYKDNNCYWLENNSIFDVFSYKMYMDLYADYSLSDKRYCENIYTNEGNRFVLLGEIIHGLFCIIMTTIILYFYFFKFNELYIYLSAIIFSAVQFALIIWYLASVFMEMKYIKNDQFWPYPLLWNVPWVIVPLYIIYYSIIEICKKVKT
jgi:hypothetical protein